MPSRKLNALVRKLLAEARRAQDQTGPVKKHCPLKLLLRSILAAELNERGALIALNRLQRHFCDWNEVRVSSPCEIAAVMNSGSDDLVRAEWIRRILTKVFNTTSEMSLTSLLEMTQTQAIRLVGKLTSVPKPETAPAAPVETTPAEVAAPAEVAVEPDGTATAKAVKKSTGQKRSAARRRVPSVKRASIRRRGTVRAKPRSGGKAASGTGRSKKKRSKR